MIVKAFVKLELVGCRTEFEVEIPDEDLEERTEYGKEKLIMQYVEEELPKYMDWGWKVK